MFIVNDLVYEIESAYRKLKSYIYHENFSLDLRMKLSKYENEQNLEEKFKALAKKITDFKSDKENEDLNNLLDGISYSIFPKRVKKETIKTGGSFYYSNSNIQDSYQVYKITPFINCSVEIHILSVLWIMKIGSKIDSDFTDNCFGNRVFRNNEGHFENNRIHLFEKYFEKYNQWRDNAIKKAKELHKQGYDVAVLNLDVKEYYNSVNYDFSIIDDYVHESHTWLNDFLRNVHKRYLKRLNDDGILKTDKNILPIGLLSSCILSNHYLVELDKKIENEIKPEYYGRYVDDILMVVSNPQITKKDENPVSSFIEKYLIDQDCWNEEIAFQKSEKDLTEYEILVNNDILIFQDEKVKLYHLLANESIEILNKFEKEIENNSSEFRLQPEASQVFETFNTESYELIYSDTINKIRSIDGIKTNKLGASKHLRKLISATQYSKRLDSEQLDEISSKILDYFSGVRSIELNQLWEKVITFFVINKAEKPLIEFIKSQVQIISDISVKRGLGNSKIIKSLLIDTLKDHLHYSIAMSSTLNRKFFREKIVFQFLLNPTATDINNYLVKINNDAKHLLDANMFRQQYSFFPLLNYCKQNSDFSYANQIIQKDTKFKIDKFKIKYSPRFIHYHELLYFYNLQKWNTQSKFDKTTNIEAKALTKYIEYNSLDKDNGYSNIYPSKNRIVQDTSIKSVTVSNSSNVKQVKMAIANIKVSSKNSIASMLGKPNLSFSRLNELNVVLNQALKNKCDLIVFPEIYLPYQWVSIITSFARKNNIGVITGIEHFTKNGRVYNYMLTALPFKFNIYKNLYVDFRLKKDYSPEEITQIEGRNGYSLPLKAEFKSDKLRLYQWKGLMFSTFNCFELCDIEKRSKFRGNVDFIVAVEYNRDLTYFSNIVESVSRDIHAYIVQVNTSQYGDSRINQPSENYLKDIVKIKGGDNVSILTATMDIAKLRNFQSYNHRLQEKTRDFKPTPPNFSMNKYRK